MALIRNIYRAYSAADLYNRASNTCDKYQGSTTLELTNITATKVKNVISGTAFTWSHLCTHANINKFSAWTPLVVAISNAGMSGEITWTNPSTNYKEWEFGGYNHSAITPAYYSTTHDDTVYTSSDSESVTVEVQFDIGEMILTNLNSALGITLAVFNGSTYVTDATRALSTLKDQCRASNSRAFTVYVNGASGSSSWDNQQSVTYTFKLFLISGTTYSYNTNEIAKLFHVQLPQFNKRIVKNFPTIAHWSVQSGYTGTSLSYSYSSGYVSGIVAKDTGSGHGRISATTYDADWNQTAYTEIYDGDVDTGGVSFNTYIGTNTQYNKIVRISFSTH